MPNPYIVGSPIDNADQFYGRKELLNSILNSSNRTFCIIGLRRVGKTSLLKRLEELFEEQNQKIAIYLSLQGRYNSYKMGHAVLKALAKKKAKHEVIKNFYYNHEEPIDLVQVLEQWKDHCEEHNVNTLLLVDEAEMLLPQQKDGNEYFPVDLENLRRVLVDEGRRIKTVITGSREIKKLRDQITPLTSPFLNGFKMFSLNPLNEEESAKLITQNQTIKIEDQLVQEIVSKCGGHPFFIQINCFDIYDYEKVILSPKSKWDLSDDILNILQDEFKRLSHLEKSLLSNLSFEKYTPFSSLSNKINAKRGELEEILRELSNLGLIKHLEGHGYRLNDIFWEFFLNQQPSKSIFISHHSKDETHLQALKTHFSHSKFIVRDENDIWLGAVVEKSLQEEINRAGLVLVLLSPDFMSHCYWIIEYAQHCNKYIIPIIARPCSLSKEIEALKCWPQNGIALSSQQDLDAALSGLPKAIESILSTLTP